MNTWRTLDDGRVEVNGQVPELSGRELESFRTKTMRWRELAEKHSARTGVPVHWILGVIWAETRGDPSLTSPAGAYGLMQVMPFNFGGRSKEQMRDPDTNMAVGSSILAASMKRHGRNLPKVASNYNAGAQKNGEPWPSTKSPWGMRENAGYITNVVTGANTAARELAASPKAEPPAGGLSVETGLSLSLLALKLLRL